MKRLKYFFGFLFLVFVISSCEDNGIFFPPSENDGVFEVTIDGKVFTTTSVNYVIDNDDLIITAIQPDTDEIFTLKVEDFDVANFSFEGVNNVATYTINDSSTSGTLNTWTTLSETSSRGSIAFTNIDVKNNTVSGTFSFIGKNTSTGSAMAFSNGSFNNIVRSARTIVPDNFTAKVDGDVYDDISLFSNLITIGNTELISINANKSLSETITINLDANITSGIYDFGSFITQSYPTGQYSVGGTTYQASGKITILNHDVVAKKISGSFNFNANDLTDNTTVFSISEGSFNVSY
jgi:hypothetical protein